MIETRTELRSTADGKQELTEVTIIDPYDMIFGPLADLERVKYMKRINQELRDNGYDEYLDQVQGERPPITSEDLK